MRFDISKPCLLNGIPELAGRADLADRAIILTLPVISDDRRQYEEVFWADFQAAQPRILAALLDAVSAALARRDSVRLKERPRMADLARWVTAAEPALGWPDGAFLAAYEANRQAVGDAAANGNPVAAAIVALMAGELEWRGTATELMLTLRAGSPALTEHRQAFPRQARPVRQRTAPSGAAAAPQGYFRCPHSRGPRPDARHHHQTGLTAVRAVRAGRIDASAPRGPKKRGARRRSG